MWRYVIKRVILAVITIAVVSLITFFVMNAVPGGPFTKEKAPSPRVQAELEARFHLNEPLFKRFVIYFEGFFKGDLGISLKTGREVATTIKTGFAVSAKIGLMAAGLAVVVGLTLGMIAALNRNKWPDRVIIFLTTFFVSVPSFILATFLLLIFTVTLKWIKIFDINNPNYVLPVISLALYPMSYITRLTKSSMLDVLGQDYIRTARAKGVSSFKVIAKHALKNGLLPIITYLGPMLAFILTGSMVVENVFAIGGLGSEFVMSINNRDYSLIMGITIFLAIVMIILTLVSDLLYKVFDPRITFD